MPIRIVTTHLEFEGQVEEKRVVLEGEEPPVWGPEAQLQVVGKPTPRVDARERVTGAAEYSLDVALPGMLTAAGLRSPHPHARITEIDTTRAEALPGIRAIFSHRNAGEFVNPASKLPIFGAEMLYHGDLVAWDVQHQKKVWDIKDNVLPVYAGVLATGGDLVFYGTLEGWFRAVDDKTGKILWQFKTGSGIIGDPITFTGPDGKQYIAVYSGIGGWMGAAAFPSMSTDDPYGGLGAFGAMRNVKSITSPGAALYVFSL